MRGKLGPILSGVGGFLLILAVLMPLYVYPNLAVAPQDQDSRSTLVATGAKVFDSDPAVLETFETDLLTTAVTVGDVTAAQREGDGVAVWVNATQVNSEDGVNRTSSIERVAFDQFTGEAVNCCDTWIEAEQGKKEKVTFKGQVFKFPFQTEQKTYQWWDSTLRRSLPAVFKGEDDIEGMKVYVFEQVIEPEIWTQQEVPASVVGEKGDGVVEADRTYSNTRTFWVEPETGVVINREEKQYSTLQVDGEDRTILTDAVVTFSDETLQANLDDYASKPALLKMIRSTLPLVLGGIGLLFVAGGIALSVRSKKPSKNDFV